MSGLPPKPPQRALPVARPIPHPQPTPQEAGPPEETSGISGKTIVLIVLAVLAVVIGVPLLLCVGIMGAAFYKGRQVAEQIQEEAAAVEQAEAEAEELAEIALKARLQEVFERSAKEAIEQQWPMPERVRRKRWTYGQVQKLNESRFALTGDLALAIRDAPAEDHAWTVEFTPIGSASSSGEWQLARVIVDGQQYFP